MCIRDRSSNSIIPRTKPIIQSVSGITKKNKTWPNFSGFSAIMPIPAAPIPCCALPVPIRPPAIAIAAASAKIGYDNPESSPEAAKAGGVTNVITNIIAPAVIAR